MPGINVSTGTKPPRRLSVHCVSALDTPQYFFTLRGSVTPCISHCLKNYAYYRQSTRSHAENGLLEQLLTAHLVIWSFSIMPGTKDITTWEIGKCIVEYGLPAKSQKVNFKRTDLLTYKRIVPILYDSQEVTCPRVISLSCWTYNLSEDGRFKIRHPFCMSCDKNIVKPNSVPNGAFQ